MFSAALRNSIFALLMLASACAGVEAPQPDMRQLGTETMDLIYREKFGEAEEAAKKIIKKYPDHPAGFFFFAVVLDAWAEYFQSNKKEDEFYRYCDLGTAKGQDLESRNPRDPWVKFFLGGLEGLKGNYEKRYERWITAFRYGWRS